MVYIFNYISEYNNEINGGYSDDIVEKEKSKYKETLSNQRRQNYESMSNDRKELNLVKRKLGLAKTIFSEDDKQTGDMDNETEDLISSTDIYGTDVEMNIIAKNLDSWDNIDAQQSDESYTDSYDI